MLSTTLNTGSPINRAHPCMRGILSRWKHLTGRFGGPRFIDLCGTANLVHTALPKAIGGGRRGGFGARNYVLASTQYSQASAAASAPHYLAASQMTLAAWIRPADLTSSQTIMCCATNGSAIYWMLEIGRTDNKITYLNNSVAVHLTSAASITAGVWTHVVLVRTGTAGAWNLELFLNGKSDATASTAANPDGTASAQTALAVLSGFGFYYSGDIDDACVWGRALSAGEVRAFYNASSLRRDPTLAWVRRPVVIGAPVAPGGNRRRRSIICGAAA